MPLSEFEQKLCVYGGPLSNYWTTQEHRFVGSSATPRLIMEEVYKPIELVDGSTLEEAVRVRGILGVMISGAVGGLLKLHDPVAFSLEPLDANGMTTHDPRLLGVWDAQNSKIVEIPGRDLTIEYYQALRLIETREPMYNYWLRHLK